MKKIYKKIISLLLICVLSICAMPNMNVIILAEEDANSNERNTIEYPFGYPNPDRFVADTLLGQSTNENGEQLGFTSFAYNPVTTRYVYKIIAEGIIDKQWLIGSSVFWKNAEDCLNGDFVDLVTWKQIMYETLIMDWLTYQFESDEFESEFEKSSAKYAWNITEYLMKDIDVYSVNGLANMSVEDAVKTLDDDFYKSNEMLGKASDFNESISSITKVVTTGLDYYKQFSKVLAAKEACYTRVEFLKAVKETTTNQDLKNAIDVVIDKLNMSSLNIAFNEGGYVMLKTVCEQTWDLLVDAIKSENALLGDFPFLTAIKLGQAGLDWLFNSNNSSTANVEMVILYMINSDFTNAYQKIRDEYQNNPTDESAAVFNNSFLEYVIFQAYASDITKNYIGQALLEGAWNQVCNLFPGGNVQKYNDLEEMLEGNISVCKGWYNLVGRYYNLYNSLLENNMKWYFGSESTETKDIPNDAVEYQGHYYFIYDNDEVSSYEQAEQYCQERNGYLATITTQEENDFLYDYISQQGCKNAYFGFNDSQNEGEWKWSNGEFVSYTNWGYDEPNNGRENDIARDENYAMFYEKNSDGTWNDGDFSENTENGGKAFICEWGEYSFQESQTQENNMSSSSERDIVLVLDVSGSMSGTPLDETKKAATNFVETILGKEANIGIVTYDSSAQRLSEFSTNRNLLENSIADIGDGGGTNIESGLEEAHHMLNSSNAKKKIIVLMSDGEPNEGKQGEELIQYANEIKNEGVLIYTLGFFESLGEDKSSAQLLMEKIASSGCHYEVADANDLVFFFEDMADQINGQKYIYVRIACPVDVSVTYKGQTLDSSEENQNLRTDFGTLTFEESDDAEESGETEESEENLSDNNDSRVKVLRLKEGKDYDLKVNGTGYGIMNYTIGFMDDEGDYNDLRKFENIKITKRTVIDTVANNSKESVLNIDEDGDGKYDLILCAGKNGKGEEIKQEKWLYIVIGGGVVLISLLIVLFVIKKHKKRKRRVNK